MSTGPRKPWAELTCKSPFQEEVSEETMQASKGRKQPTVLPSYGAYEPA